MAEFLQIGAGSGVRSHVSHFHGPAAVLLPEVAKSQALGVDLTYDTYPYRRGNTILAMLALPKEIQAGVPSQTLLQLATSEARSTLKRDWFPGLAELFTRVTLSHVPVPEWNWAEGLTVPEPPNGLASSPATWSAN